MITIRFANDLTISLQLEVAKSSNLVRDILIETPDSDEEIFVNLSPKKKIFDLFCERMSKFKGYQTCSLMKTKEITNEINITYDLPADTKEFYQRLNLEELTDLYEIASFMSIELLRQEMVVDFYNRLKDMSVPEIKTFLNKEGEVNMIKLNTAKEVKKSPYRVFSYVMKDNN